MAWLGGNRIVQGPGRVWKGPACWETAGRPPGPGPRCGGRASTAAAAESPTLPSPPPLVAPGPGHPICRLSWGGWEEGRA